MNEQQIQKLKDEQADNQTKIDAANEKIKSLEHEVTLIKWDIARWNKANKEIAKTLGKL